jgi:magnesium chelatase family protein
MIIPAAISVSQVRFDSRAELLRFPGKPTAGKIPYMALRLGHGNLDQLLGRDHTLYGSILYGLDGHTIELQARAQRVLRSPTSWRNATNVIGMARGALSEALDRISGAFSKFKVAEPQVEILVNLAPADLPKEGTWLDLPIAIIMLQAAGILPDLATEQEAQFVLTGELSIHGELRRVPGVLSLAYAARPNQVMVVPAGNERECALITARESHKGCKIQFANTIGEVMDFFLGRGQLGNVAGQTIKFESLIAKPVDFSGIRGQDRAKRGAVIAAAGGHNLLLIGPPGEGKSLLASGIPGILPKLSTEEKIELTRIYSAYGALDHDGVAVTRRPMRSVHHSISKQALVGGGTGIPRPGEITLAHLGVLFMDEIAEFSGATIDSLRQPMESGYVDISRVGGSLRFPARFSLVAAMNPCPCGYFGGPECKCKESDVKRYQSKLSGPIVDRIDLQVEMSRLTVEERFGPAAAEGESDRLLTNVEAARARQASRYDGQSIPNNAALPGGNVRELCRFSETGLGEYKSVVEKHTLTTRSVDRLAKVSRTIADLGESDQIQPEHVTEAASFVVGGVLRDSFR